MLATLSGSATGFIVDPIPDEDPDTDATASVEAVPESGDTAETTGSKPGE
jgi:hypothetical protein